ncbi:uncharacterized protein PADG_11829 [Paracoccidioides brasiliensis Pb18]|uniref:Uncharacterized protein n=1 Tax=Paracoccidioides brasiliensis (strain Pb18) TaxID=502780 RepID=A0A0A0HUL0_PARBD|nr:uncharacterized protein PADG_11829 [Paracoccidioides brasiliensis Pb18]KGM92038.1 hypothetical protein PADG_11829 [Paracoccidioides brasiliensis Pb18]
MKRAGALAPADAEVRTSSLHNAPILLTDSKSTYRWLSRSLNSLAANAGTPFKSVGFSEYCVFNGREFSCKRGTQQWIESEELEGNLPTLDRALRLLAYPAEASRQRTPALVTLCRP